MKLRYTVRARRHLEAIAFYIERDNPVAAQRVILAIRSSVKRLEDHPKSGRRIAGGGWELVTPGLPYLVVYRIGRRHIDIVGVFHAARHPSVRARP